MLVFGSNQVEDELGASRRQRLPGRAAPGGRRLTVVCAGITTLARSFLRPLHGVARACRS